MEVAKKTNFINIGVFCLDTFTMYCCDLVLSKIKCQIPMTNYNKNLEQKQEDLIFY